MIQNGNYSIPPPPSPPPPVSGTFLNTLKFTVKDCDPNTGEPDEDLGFPDEYVVSEGLKQL